MSSTESCNDKVVRQFMPASAVWGIIGISLSLLTVVFNALRTGRNIGLEPRAMRA